MFLWITLIFPVIRSAHEAEAREKEALSKGETLPEEKRFDSNCITPGTHFMARLNEQLKYFVNKKQTYDSSWQGVRVYLSGHEVRLQLAYVHYCTSKCLKQCEQRTCDRQSSLDHDCIFPNRQHA